ncbi:MAG TPA: (Fe-S)-binding protein [Candidatus Dormibacteraeota bacterium]|jgi:Fe-S oxidoreductase|nr:(Fe-S)-binding protein [Candidatus Dormibacteraeota bacterium]
MTGVTMATGSPDVNQFFFSSIAGSLIVAALAFFLFKITQFVTVLRIGSSDQRFDRIPERVMAVVTGVGAHDRMVRRKYSGVLHLFVFYGFVLLGTSIFQVFAEATLPGFKPDPPLVNSLIALIQDLFAVLVLIGVGMALYNRLFIHPLRYKGSHEDDGFRILIGIALVMLTQLSVTGSRLNLNANSAYGFDPSTNWRPVSQVVSAIFSAVGVNAQSADFVHHAALLANIVVVLAFLAYLPTSKHQHIYLAIENIFLRNLNPIGALPKLDIENAEHYGASRIEHFSWKHLLDTYTCTECGRCQDQCPAYLTDKPLSPKMLIMDLRDHLHDHAPDLIRLSGLPEKEKAEVAAQVDAEHPEHKPLIGGTILEETLWSCTMCGACMSECPVLIEHVPKIADMRRSLVLEESKMPKQAEGALRSIETSGNPYQLSNQNRADWAADLGVQTYAEHPDAEYLYFVGCAASFDEANQKVATSIVKILQAADIDFAILGKEETCNGDPARRIGNEYLFQMQAEANITTFKNYKVKKVLTGCPHCFNTLKNEYPQFGFDAEVIHHTEFIQTLIDDGRLKLDPLAESVLRGKTVTYHDPCYLGRWNGVYEPGRRVLEHIQGLEQIEMHRHGRQAFCCGAGGGRMWMEETLGKRINRERMQHAAEVDADLVATACPFCLTMMMEGATSQNLPIDVADVAQMVATQLPDDKRVPLQFGKHDDVAPMLEVFPPKRTVPNANDVHPFDPVPRPALLHELKVGPEDLVPIAMPHIPDPADVNGGEAPTGH